MGRSRHLPPPPSNPQNDSPQARSLKQNDSDPTKREDGIAREREWEVGRVMCVSVRGRVHHMTVKEDPSLRGVREETGGGGCRHHDNTPLSDQTSKEGGRTSNPNRQRSNGSFLKGYTPRRRRRRAREGRVGRPRPSGDAPTAPRPQRAHPRPRNSPGVAQVPVPGNSAASARPAPGGEKGVCERPAGARTSPPSSRRLYPPAPLHPGADPAGPFPPS